ncbi:MAG: glycosyltransferase 87 family protein [Candidatus Methanoplasma sp.]|jgi:hypothetical protein|nr:glycosyltransferase 87 family protein [Candidatus Methanoplasma sp.]
MAFDALLGSAAKLLRRPVVSVLLVGIAVRLAIFPFMEVGYDSDFWALIIRNMQSGEGLYGLEGYYYTPVWGYILGVVSLLGETFLNIGVMGERLVGALPAESYTAWFLSGTVTTVPFNIWIKLSLLVSDILVGYTVYRLVKDKTGDEKKAALGFALWFLCPAVICVTSISGMFDTFSVLFTLLSLMLVRKDRPFLGGSMLALAVLTKFFPAYLFFVLIAYIAMKHRDDRKAARGIACFCAGMTAMALVMVLPQILDGTVLESLLFMTNRASGGGGTLIGMLTGLGAVSIYGLLVPASAYLALRMYRSRRDPDSSLFKYALLIVALVFIYPPTPQYLMLLIPFLAYYSVVADREFLRGWAVVSVGAAAFVLAGNFFHMLSFGAFLGPDQLAHIMELAAASQQTLFLGQSAMGIAYTLAGAVQYLGVLSVLYIFLRNHALSRKGPGLDDPAIIVSKAVESKEPVPEECGSCRL